MATKLKNLNITKVDFVDAGANQRANIVLRKRDSTGKGGEPMEEKNIVRKMLSAIAKAFGIGDKDADEVIADVLKVDGKADADDVEPDSPDENGEPQTAPKKGETAVNKVNKSEGEDDEMSININKSLLTQEERMFLEAIEKKAGIPDDSAGENPAPGGDAPTEGSVAKGAQETSAATPQAAQEQPTAEQGADMFKGLDPAIAAIIKNLQTKADQAEERELMEVAKKYEILGSKPEDLVPMLKSLKQDPAQYEKTIALLDSAVAATSGTFAEIGKKGSLDNPNGSAWDKIEKKAAEIRKSNPAMEYHAAIDKACEQNPELVAEYEQNR